MGFLIDLLKSKIRIDERQFINFWNVDAILRNDVDCHFFKQNTEKNVI
jgi:hypothetical protein